MTLIRAKIISFDKTLPSIFGGGTTLCSLHFSNILFPTYCSLKILAIIIKWRYKNSSSPQPCTYSNWTCRNSW